MRKMLNSNWSALLVAGLAVLWLCPIPAVAQESAATESTVEESGHGDAHAAGGGHEDLGHGNAGPQLSDAAEFKTDLAIYTFVVFLLLLAILSKFAWPPIIQALEARERHIADNISAAEARHDDAKKLLADYEAKLAATAGEVRELLEEARRDAEHTKSRIVAEARQAADEEKSRALREIERAKDGALHDLAITSANLAIDLSRQVVREQLQITPEYQARIVRDALGKLAAAAPGKN